MSLGKPSLILLGAGGHCNAVIDVVEAQAKYKIKGILEPNPVSSDVLGYPILGNDDLISKLVDDDTYFLITVGQIKSYRLRQLLSDKLSSNNAKLATVISPHALVSNYAKINKGSVIMHRAAVGVNAFIGKHCIINTMANLEHDTKVKDFCHISTGAMINGSTIVNRGCFIGSNATLSNNIEIKENSIISAGKFVK